MRGGNEVPILTVNHLLDFERIHPLGCDKLNSVDLSQNQLKTETFYIARNIISHGFEKCLK